MTQFLTVECSEMSVSETLFKASQLQLCTKQNDKATIILYLQYVLEYGAAKCPVDLKLDSNKALNSK